MAPAKSTLLSLPPAWLLVLCSALGPLAMTIAVPATTQIMREFSTDYGVAQLNLSVYLLAMGVAQLFLGFLSDRFGRRPVMIAGLSIFVAGCALSALAPTLEVLLVSRAIQGIGSSVGVSLSRAIVRDVYSREKSASVIAYLSMAMVVAPMLGPGIGGALTQHASWRLLFVVLGAAGVIALLLSVRYLHETAAGHTDQNARPKFVSATRSLLTEPAYVGYVVGMVFAGGMFFSFQAAAPFLVMELMGRTPTEYGIWLIVTALGYFGGNFVSGRYTQRFGPDTMIRVALIPAVLGIATLWALQNVMHPAALLFPVALLTFSNGLTIPNATAAALSVRPRLAGTAAGLAGFFQIGIGALLSMLVGFWQSDSNASLLWTLTVCAALTACGAWIGHHFRKKARSTPCN